MHSKKSAHQGKVKEMGTFKVDIEAANLPEQTACWRLFRGDLVDTGSEATWLPESELTKMGIQVFKKDIRFLMANGQVITRDIGIALIRTGPFKAVDEVVLAKPGDLLITQRVRHPAACLQDASEQVILCQRHTILGVHTLEAFPATVDPYNKKLVASRPLPAAAA